MWYNRIRWNFGLGNPVEKGLKIILNREAKLSGKKFLTDDRYNEIFPPELGLPRNAGSQWSDTDPKEKMKRGLKLYKIEPPDFVDFRFDFQLYLGHNKDYEEMEKSMFSKPDVSNPK